MKRVEISCSAGISHCHSAKNRSAGDNNTVEKVNMPEMNPQMPEINIRPIRTPLFKSFKHDSKIHIHS